MRQEVLLLFDKYLLYNHLTGIVTAKEYRKRVPVGTALGSENSDGYLQITLFGQNYKLHQVVWYLHVGYWPDFQVDHVNGVRSDNRSLNLRLVTQPVNLKNKGTYKSNGSGSNGVHFHRRQLQWIASIRVEGVAVHLGSFEDKEDAINARNLANIKYGFHENHGRKLLEN